MLRFLSRSLSFLLSIGIFALFASTAFAKELRIGFADFPPFKYKEGEKNIGSDTEIVEATVKIMGYEALIDMKPWKRVQEDAKTGKYDLIYSFTQNPERDQSYYFSEPISTVKNVFFKRKGEAISWKELKDLEKYIIATSASYNYGTEFAAFAEANKTKIQEFTGASPELSNLKKLAAKRVDLFICESSVCNYVIRTNKGQDASLETLEQIDTPVGGETPFRAGFPKGSTPEADAAAKKLRDAFNEALATLVKSGKRKEILKKYGISSSLN